MFGYARAAFEGGLAQVLWLTSLRQLPFAVLHFHPATCMPRDTPHDLRAIHARCHDHRRRQHERSRLGGSRCGLRIRDDGHSSGLSEEDAAFHERDKFGRLVILWREQQIMPPLRLIAFENRADLDNAVFAFRLHPRAVGRVRAAFVGIIGMHFLQRNF